MSSKSVRSDRFKLRCNTCGRHFGPASEAGPLPTSARSRSSSASLAFKPEAT